MNAKKAFVGGVVVAFLLCGVFGGLVTQQSLATVYPEIYLDFGTSGSPCKSGYVNQSGAVFDGALGYGWSSDQSFSSRDRASGDDLDRDLITFNSNVSFYVAVPMGVYDVSIRVGDTYDHTNETVMLEGEYVSSNLTLAANVWQTLGVSGVSCVDGYLTFVFGTVDGVSYWVVNGIMIEPADSFVANSVNWGSFVVSLFLVSVSILLSLKSKSWAVNFLFGLATVGYLSWTFSNTVVETYGGWLDFMVLIGAILVLVKGAVLVRASGV